MTTLTLEGLKPLTTKQGEAAREAALDRVRVRLGQRPTREQFRRELGPLWTALDLIALVVFTAALVVSSVHIVKHMGQLAAASYDTLTLTQAGTIISRDFYVAVHQWGFIFLAEGSMILFLVLFGMARQDWRKWVYLGLSLGALAFVFIANWQSGIGVLESVLAPVFTVGIGLKLEHLIVQAIARRKAIDQRYLDALAVWEAASMDPADHPEYLKFYRRELWDALLKKNPAYTEAPAGFKWAAVERELARDQWTAHQDGAVLAFDGEGDKRPADTPFGPIAPAQGGLDSMRMTVLENGHGGAVNGRAH